MNPLISVIIPTYNKVGHLELTLSCLGKQDLPSEVYEVIVINDGSTDGTEDFLRRQKVDYNLRSFHQPNYGQAIARNFGLRQANGELVVFIDDDLLFTSTCMMYLNSDTTFKYGQSSPYNVHFTPLPLRLNGKHVFAFAIGKSVLFNKREDKDFQAPDFVGAISFDVIGGDMNVICDKEIKLQLKEPIVPGGNTLEQFRVFNLEKTNLRPIISWSGAPINTTNYLLKVNKMVKEEGELKEKVVWELLLPGNVDNYLEYGENIDNAIVETPPEELEPDTPYVINLVALNEKQQPFFIALGFFILTNYEEM